MELQTISQLSEMFHISTRTLRYYEKLGLISSIRKEGSAYRSYDEHTIMRVQQIVILRKLRIPLKQIAEILQGDSAYVAIQVLEDNLSKVDDELTSLSTIRDIIRLFIEKMNLNPDKFMLPDDESILELADSLTMTKINFKEKKTMEDLNHASAKLNKLTDKDVRIIYLPPSTVASYQYIGDEPEMHCGQVIDRFVLETDLTAIKPDLRHYGFNSPVPDETGYHGYERWITIPDDMEVPEPIVKKKFEGGLYAAHMIPFGAFEEWEWLNQWVSESDKYEYNGDWDCSIMFGWLEEHLNYINHVHLPNSEPPELQLDLLIPIKEIV